MINRCVYKSLIFLLPYILVLFCLMLLPVSAAELPRPEEGMAVGTASYECDGGYSKSKVEFAVTVRFWNVGSNGGPQFQPIVATLSRQPTKECSLGGTEFTGIFSGGPYGTVKNVTAGDWKMTVGEQYVTLTWWNGSVARIPIQRPEIFTKYDWTPGAAKSKIEDSGAGFSNLFGQVEVNMPNEDGTYDEENWQYAKLDGRSFPVGTHIKTSKNSGGIISFADMTTFHLKPGTEIIISSPAADPDNPLRLLAGEILTNVKKMMKDGSMQIEMSQAVAGIKGTTFVLSENGETSVLKVIEGTVEYRSKATNASEMVPAGQMVIADKDGLQIAKAFNINEENKSWEDFFEKTAVPKSDDTNKNEDGNGVSMYVFLTLSIFTLIGGAWYVLKKRKHKDF